MKFPLILINFINQFPGLMNFKIMKYSFFILVFILLCNSTKSQYSVNKLKYDYRTYVHKVGDPYNPSLAGIASFLIPGLGQMISGEGGRGVAFLGGYSGCWVLYGIGATKASNAIRDDLFEYQGEGTGLMVVGALGAIIVNIWSIVDAVHVAKVNNLAWQDKHKPNHYQLQPYIFHDYNMNYSQVGLKATINF